MTKEDDGIHIYYERWTEYRDGKSHRHPFATVAIKKLGPDEGVARGISFCNPVDNFDRREGRKLAVGRLRRALGTRECSGPIRMVRRRVWLTHKSMYHAVSTEKERRILNWIE